MTTEELPRGRANGDETDLFQRYGRRLRATVRRRVRTSAANIEDACAFAWLQLLRYQPARETAFSWLCTTAIHQAVKFDSRGRRTASLDSEEYQWVADERQELEQRLELIAAVNAIAAARLRPRERHVIALRVAGYSRGEVAAATGDSYRTVDRQLERARRKLRRSRGAQRTERALDSDAARTPAASTDEEGR